LDPADGAIGDGLTWSVAVVCCGVGAAMALHPPSSDARTTTVTA
jgi:hypothetical protein